MKYLLLTIFLVFLPGIPGNADVYIHGFGTSYWRNSYFITPLTPPVGGNLTFLTNNLQFNGSVLTFLGD
jgi:hypothetical protein